MRAALLVCAAIAVLYALLFARPHPTPGPPMRDFEAYYAAGALTHGLSPYGTKIWSVEQYLDGVNARRYEVLPFVSPPATLPVWSAIARLSFAQANAVWRGIELASLAALVLVVLRFTGSPITIASFFALAIASLGFGPLTSAVALGQVALPAFLFAALALLAPPVALFAWTQPNVALVLLSQWDQRKAVASFVLTFAIFIAVCIAVSGVQGTQQYLDLLQMHDAAERFSAIQLTPAAIAYGFGAAPAAASGIGAVIAFAAIAFWFTGVRRIKDPIARFAFTCAMLPLVLPFFHEHDLLVAFVPAVLFVIRADSRIWPLASIGALLCATDWFGLAQRPDGWLQTLLLVGSMAAALVALRPDAHWRMLLAPASVLLLIGAVSVFAAHDPAPIWPDAMRALPNGVRALDISAVWHAEQLASGLLTPNPFWAILRSLSLTGCALLAYAGLIVARVRPASSCHDTTSKYPPS